MKVPLYRFRIAAPIAGVSYRQADHWATLGHVPLAQEAQGSGTQRLIGPAGFATLCRIQQLRAFGIQLALAADPPPKLASLVDEADVAERLRELDQLTPSGWLVDGEVTQGLTRAEVLEIVNRHRADVGLPPLPMRRYNTALKVARHNQLLDGPVMA